MELLHIALINSSVENSDRFYRDLLGLEKKPPRQVPADLMKQLFNQDIEATLINYVGDSGLFFEMFITSASENTSLSHCCLEVDNRDTFLTKCENMSVSIRRFLKDDGGSIIFIEDYDKNLFEIKEKI